MRSISISISKSKSKNAAYHKYFNTIEVSTLKKLVAVTSSTVWSPCRWQTDVRLMKNFAGCDIAALDFDGGVKLAAVAYKVDRLGITHVIMTTKSHQVEKRTGTKVYPPRDRFRLIMPLDQPMHTEIDRYKWQMAWLQWQYPGSDKACKDPARYYFPGTKLVQFRDNNRYLCLPTAPSCDEIAERYRTSISHTRNQVAAGVYPRWLREFLNRGVPTGERRPTVFKAAACLCRCGIDPEKIEQLIKAAPIDRCGITEKDLMRHITNGIKTAKNT
jgi:hypothetical protein